MVSGGVVGWEKAEDVLCLSLYACPKMHYVMIMQGATHREARAVGGEPASSSNIPCVHSIFTLLLTKQIFQKNKSSRAASASRTEIWPEISAGHKV